MRMANDWFTPWTSAPIGVTKSGSAEQPNTTDAETRSDTKGCRRGGVNGDDGMRARRRRAAPRGAGPVRVRGGGTVGPVRVRLLQRAAGTDAGRDDARPDGCLRVDRRPAREHFPQVGAGS